MKTILAVLIVLASPLFGAYTIKEGKLISVEKFLLSSPQEHYSSMLSADEKKEWKRLQAEAELILHHFSETPFYQEALFFLGKSYFNQQEYEQANKNLSSYLKKQTALTHFSEAIELKFLIAEEFRKGAKKHLMGWEVLPKWIPAYEEALSLYEEVIGALPNDALAAQALFGKASLEFLDGEWEKAIESNSSLIRRFPHHSLTKEAYLQIGKIYLLECQETYPDANFLDLAEINFKKFTQDFPSDEKLQEAENMLQEMREIYAKSFYEIARFFERTKKTKASLIYYSKIIKQYPKTKCAELSKERLSVLLENPPLKEEKLILAPAS